MDRRTDREIKLFQMTAKMAQNTPKMAQYQSATLARCSRRLGAAKAP
jgi:hypothetical protein